MTRQVDKTRERYINIEYPKMKAKARDAYKAFTNPINARTLHLYNTIMSGRSKFNDDLKLYEEGLEE